MCVCVCVCVRAVETDLRVYVCRPMLQLVRIVVMLTSAETVRLIMGREKGGRGYGGGREGGGLY